MTSHTINYAIKKWIFFFNRSCLHNGQGPPMKFNKYINHLIHQVMFDLWQHLHLLQGQI